MAVRVGQDVGNYHIIEALGQGGMARVYKAYDTRLDREVAIKLIRVDMIGPAHLEHMLKRFEREAQALAKFLHPNIVPVHDFGEYEGSPYLVMAYLPGGSVKELTGKPIPYAQAARLLAPVARALEYAHEKNIIHRDVKPGNILLTERGVPMLSDFGIAKLLGVDETTSLTGTGGFVGTPEYMAPEQWQGKVAPQTDIYALGVVFYELVTGCKPYTADTPAAILIKQITEPLPKPRSFVPDLPEEVEQVLYRALAKDVENRYASMGEFAVVLERLGIQPSLTPDHLVPTPTPSSLTARTLPVMAGTPIPLPLTVISLQNAGRVATLARWDNTDGVCDVAFCPDGRILASGSHDKTVKLWRVSDGSLLFTLMGHTYAVRSVAFSPDSATLASGSWDTTVKLWRVADGNLFFTLQGHTVAVRSVAFSPDGATLASGSQDKTVKLWQVSDGNLLSTLTGHTHVVNSVAFSPDGATLASGSYDTTVKLWRVSDGSLLSTLQGHMDWVTSVAFAPDGKTLASGSGDGTVKLWRVSDGSLLSTLQGHMDWIMSVAFSPDGALLASGSWDNTIRLWQVSDGSLLSTLQDAGGVNGVNFAPDGMLLASGSSDGTIRLWGVP